MKIINSDYQKLLTIYIPQCNSKSFAYFIVTPLFFLACTIVFSQQKTLAPRALDSIVSLPIDSTLSWMRKNQYTNIDNYQEIGLHTIKKALVTKDPIKIAESHEEMANWYGYHGLYPQDSTLFHSKKTLEYYQLSGEKIKIAETLKTLAVDYLNDNSLDKAHTALFDALAIYKELKDEQGMAGVYRVLGVLLDEMGKPLEAIKYTKQAILLFEKADNHASSSVAHLTLISSYTKAKDYEKAYEAADKCIEIVNTTAQEEVFVRIRAYNSRGNISIETQDYDQALKDYTKSWELCVAEIGKERANTYRTGIGNTLRLQGKYKEGIAHLLAGIQQYEGQENERIWTLYDQLTDCYKNVGDTEKAFVYLEKSRNGRNKFYKDQIKSLEAESIVKYETGKKDEALAAQELVLEQKNKVQRLIIGISVLLLMLLGLLLYFLKKSRYANSKITAKNAENELLLKEIHHRVKNNLEMVKSLISLQSAQLEDSATKDAMIASQNRVQSMGIIHQKLYQGTNLGSIEMKDYFINLGEGILDSFNAEDKVKIACAMDNLELDVDTAVPIGLIVNELLTNSLKYAFPKDKKGKIEISLSKPNSDILTLKVTDNGIGKIIGLPVKGTGFGSQLVQLLTQQLNGSMQENTQNGTSVSFIFKLDKAA